MEFSWPQSTADVRLDRLPRRLTDSAPCFDFVWGSWFPMATGHLSKLAEELLEASRRELLEVSRNRVDAQESAYMPTGLQSQPLPGIQTWLRPF